MLKRNYTQIQPAFTVILAHVTSQACIPKAKHRRHHETSSYGSYLPCYFPSGCIIAINAPRACQSKPECPIRALTLPLVETSALQKRVTGHSCVSCATHGAWLFRLEAVPSNSIKFDIFFRLVA